METLKNFDFVSFCHKRGMFSTLERIFLSLDHKSLVACQSTCQQWNQIISEIFRDDFPRIRKFLEAKLNHSWALDVPLVLESNLEDFIIDRCHSMQADDEFVAIDADVKNKVDLTTYRKIIILHSKSLKLAKLLKLEGPFGELLDGGEENHMVWNGNFLVASILFSKDTNFPFGFTYNLIWDRSNNFEKVEIPTRGKVTHNYFARRSVARLPLVRNGVLQVLNSISFVGSISKSTMQFWDLAAKTSTSKEIQRPAYFLALTGGRYFTKPNPQTIHLCEDGSPQPIWSLSNGGLKGEIIGYTDKHVAIEWMTRSTNNIMIYSLENGKEVSRFQVDSGFALTNRVTVGFSPDRVAILHAPSPTSPDTKRSDFKMDLFVYDLTSGACLFSLEERLNVKNVKHFALLKNQLVYVSNGKVYSAVMG